MVHSQRTPGPKLTGRWCGRKRCKLFLRQDTGIDVCRQYGCRSLKSLHRN